MKLFIIVLVAISLQGCFWNTKEEEVIEVISKPMTRVPLILPQVDHFRTRDIKWMIITEENYKETIDKLPSNTALFSITSKDYERLSLNNGDILKLIKQLKSQLKGYKLYYTQSEQAITDYNTSNRLIPGEQDIGEVE